MRIQQINNLLKQNVPMLIVATVLLVCVMSAPTFGVTVETLKAPVKDLKDTIFGGWMWVPKIGCQGQSKSAPDGRAKVHHFFL